MKKQVLFSFILAIVAMMWTIKVQAQAEENEISIAGAPITHDNCNDLSVIDGVSGIVKYDEATKTLTLENATIHNSAETINGPGIYNIIGDLTIRIIGNNTIVSEKSVGLWNGPDNTLTFIGDGKLTIIGSSTASDKNFQKGIFNRGSIIVSNCTIEVSGGEYGLCDGYWKFERCNLRAKGGGINTDNYAGSISWIWDNKPELIECIVNLPEGAYWQEFQQGEYAYYSLFGKDDKVVTDWVSITKDATSIEFPANKAKDTQKNFSLSGISISNDLNKLPKGVYIVNGKKVVKQ